MARMIDAEALARAMGVRTYMQTEWTPATAWGVPIVDAEPVVRCKDCEYWGLNRTWLKDGEVYVQDCFVNEMMTKPDFFCASGEKKELKEIENGTLY